MPKPNANFRTREMGWVFGALKGNGGTTGHGNLGNLAAGGSTLINDFRPVQVNLAILGGIQSTPVAGIPDTHAVYMEVQAHLRSAGNLDLPGQIRISFSEIANSAVTFTNQGDWSQAQFQEWEDWSPLTVPTPPPGFSSGGGNGQRYEYRRYLGRVPGNIIYTSLTNLGSVAATEWALGVFFRSSPPTFAR